MDDLTAGKPRRGRGMAQKSLDLIEACREILEEIQPTSVRSVCYQLFTRGLIPNMSRSETAKVSRLLVAARETGVIPWSHIVDETREAERVNGWSGLGDYSETILRSYRRDFWTLQPETVEVWSEKGTVRGTLAPVLNLYAVTFRVLHGFGSATSVHEVALETERLDRPLIVLYVGDYDPSGLRMSEVDLPDRLDRYGGNVELIRAALTKADVERGDLPSFEAETKRGDPRYRWFLENYGRRCWELDAMSPNVLRRRIEDEIVARIDADAWTHCRKTEDAERESMAFFFESWPRG
jgi:hypothetical protein